MNDSELRKVEGWSPGACAACWRETDDLHRVRSLHYRDEEYVTEENGHRAWFLWFCDICYRSYTHQAKKYGYKQEELYARISQAVWTILDALGVEPGGDDE